MASTNKTVKRPVIDNTAKLAGAGKAAAFQTDEQTLRRCVLANLLWEKNAYQDGEEISAKIAQLVPRVPAAKVAALAVEARFEQKLRHVPLFLVREMLRYDSHRPFVAETLAKVIHRADELSEFVALYYKDVPAGTKKKTLPRQAKIGLSRAFQKFDEYQLAKHNKDSKEYSLRDVMFMCHAKPKDGVKGFTRAVRKHTADYFPPGEGSTLYRKLVDDKLATPWTWEVLVSAAKDKDEKRAAWVELLNSNRLGASAFLKNLRNMNDVGVPHELIARTADTMTPHMLLPIDFLKAAKYAPFYIREIENLMFRCAAQWPRLDGWTVFVVDVSGSMAEPLSQKSEFKRIDAANSMCLLASELCQRVSIYATGGDRTSHKTVPVPAYRGFALSEEILRYMYGGSKSLGGNGIFTTRCMDYLRAHLNGTPDRVIVLSDSQDVDAGSALPDPPGHRNYIADISAHTHGVNYRGRWDAEITGWSESFLKYIYAMENG
jgi:60 kDa SS-A/Ro ribonucleoprotein